VEDPNQEAESNDFVFTITSGPNDIRIVGQPPADCQDVGDVNPGAYEVNEEPMAGVPDPDSIEVEGDCTQDPTDARRTTGEIQAGETHECTFINISAD
jgi:hypothetical protein